MRAQSVRRESGQTLIQIAILMFFLLIIVALAVDAGNLYAERRRMQNAADAEALAGAHEICFGTPANWESTAQAYALANGAQVAEPYPVGGWTVGVTASKPVQTFLAGLAGIVIVDVAAVAEATCGEAVSACGLWPVTFDEEDWNYLSEDSTACGELIYVWEGNNENKDVDCDLCDCDVDGDGDEDIVNMAGRAWVDFTDAIAPGYPDDCSTGGQGCGNSEIKCWLLHDSGAKVPLDACLPGTRGTKTNKKDVNERANGPNPVVAIPLYDSTGCPANPCGQGDTFQVAGFGCITVLGWEQKLKVSCEGGKDWWGKAIEAAVACDACETYCGTTGGDPPLPAGVRAVSLTR